MFKSPQFSTQEWLLFLILLLIPLINIIFILKIIYEIGFFHALKKVVFALIIYITLGIIALSLGGLRLTF